MNQGKAWSLKAFANINVKLKALYKQTALDKAVSNIK